MLLPVGQPIAKGEIQSHHHSAMLLVTFHRQLDCRGIQVDGEEAQKFRHQVNSPFENYLSPFMLWYGKDMNTPRC
jgi:hypothetical protein